MPRSPRDEALAIDMDDFDYLKGSRSRLRMGATLSRDEMLRLALMSSENRAASALARHYPGGTQCLRRGDERQGGGARHDAARITRIPPGFRRATCRRRTIWRGSCAPRPNYPLIREYSTTPAHYVEVQPTGQTLGFNNSNALVKNGAWDIQLQKTGYIREAGRCVVMLATIAQPADGDRAARFDRQVHAARRRAARQALARNRRGAAGAAWRMRPAAACKPRRQRVVQASQALRRPRHRSSPTASRRRPG